MAKAKVQVGRLQPVDRPGLITWQVPDISARDALTTLDGTIPITAADVGRVCRVGTAAPYEYHELLSTNPNTWTPIGHGVKGDAGASAYQVWLDAGNTGTEQAFLDSLAGPKGEPGADGADGDPGASAYAVAIAGGFASTRADWLASLKGASAYEVAVAGGYGGDKAQWLASLKGPAGESAYQIAQDGGFVGSKTQWIASLEGPKGDTGAKGDAGSKGDPGNSAYEVAVAGGYSGTKADWLASLQGPKGDAGPKGDPGDSAYEVAVAGGYGGTEADWLASLQGPKGDTGTQGGPGPAGASAYDVAVNGGYSGTEQDWLDSLKGASAYQVAVNGGYSGTEADWLASLEGASAYDVAVANGFVGTEPEWLDSLHATGGGSGGGSDGPAMISVQIHVPTLDIPNGDVAMTYVAPNTVDAIAIHEDDVSVHAAVYPDKYRERLDMMVDGNRKGRIYFSNPDTSSGYWSRVTFDNSQLVLKGGQGVVFPVENDSPTVHAEHIAMTMQAKVVSSPVAKAGLDVEVVPGGDVSVGEADVASEGGTLSVQWTTDGDGTFADPNASVTTYTAGTTPEFYTLTKTVTEDTYGLTVTDTAQLRVLGNIQPIITLNGDSTVELWNGDTFNDPGATASDAEDGDISANVTISGTVDTSTNGTYTVTYSVTDSGGKSASVQRTVIVSTLQHIALTNGTTKTLAASDAHVMQAARVAAFKISTPTTLQKISIASVTELSGVSVFVSKQPIQPFDYEASKLREWDVFGPSGELGELLVSGSDTWYIALILDGYVFGGFTFKPTDITVSWASFDEASIPIVPEATQVANVANQPWELEAIYKLDPGHTVTNLHATMSLQDGSITSYANPDLIATFLSTKQAWQGEGGEIQYADFPSGVAYLHFIAGTPDLAPVTMTAEWQDRYPLSDPPTVLSNGVGVAADNATEYEIDPPFYAYGVLGALSGVTGTADLVMEPNYPLGDSTFSFGAADYYENQHDVYYAQVRGSYSAATLTVTWKEATAAQSGVDITGLSNDGTGEPPVWYVNAPAGASYGLFTVEATGGTGDSYLYASEMVDDQYGRWEESNTEAGTAKKLQAFTSGEPMYFSTRGNPAFSGVTITPTYAPPTELANHGSFTVNAGQVGPYNYDKFLLKFTVPAGATGLTVTTTTADAIQFITIGAPEYAGGGSIDGASTSGGHTYTNPAPAPGDYYIQYEADAVITGATITVDWA